MRIQPGQNYFYLNLIFNYNIYTAVPGECQLAPVTSSLLSKRKKADKKTNKQTNKQRRNQIKISSIPQKVSPAYSLLGTRGVLTSPPLLVFLGIPSTPASVGTVTEEIDAAGDGEGIESAVPCPAPGSVFLWNVRSIGSPEECPADPENECLLPGRFPLGAVQV